LGQDARERKERSSNTSEATSGAYDPDQYVFPRDCPLEAMRTQGRISLLQGVATRAIIRDLFQAG
jgi:hypothetical protein